ncbi:hypothetical protein OF829_20440 [Sphingomonas sp. LB-2]|uniref:hypothetical protein n=1 Tax=Sphingomonas caeni TaxID=2984949 RepID=UPI00222F6C5B|nr:hypothetical protein [Sphingomonas caeni]MCW3849612.1 hypothetical protein [Sphingomonas caeni]
MIARAFPFAAAFALVVSLSQIPAEAQIVDPDYVGSYGAWSVRCPQDARDQFGRVQCEGVITVSGISIVARRVNDEVTFELRSSACPGVVSEAVAARAMFDGRLARYVTPAQSIQVVLAASLSAKANECSAFAVQLRLNRDDTYAALGVVATPRKPKKHRD